MHLFLQIAGQEIDSSPKSDFHALNPPNMNKLSNDFTRISPTMDMLLDIFFVILLSITPARDPKQCGG